MHGLQLQQVRHFALLRGVAALVEQDNKAQVCILIQLLSIVPSSAEHACVNALIQAKRLLTTFGVLYIVFLSVALLEQTCKALNGERIPAWSPAPLLQLCAPGTCPPSSALEHDPGLYCRLCFSLVKQWMQGCCKHVHHQLPVNASEHLTGASVASNQAADLVVVQDVLEHLSHQRKQESQDIRQAGKEQMPWRCTGRITPYSRRAHTFWFRVSGLLGSGPACLTLATRPARRLSTLLSWRMLSRPCRDTRCPRRSSSGDTRLCISRLGCMSL